jgi:hypothetical protein
MSAQDGLVDIIRLGPMVVEEVPEDDFRRVWTGHALIPVQKSRHISLLLTSFLAGSLIGVGVLRVIR